MVSECEEAGTLPGFDGTGPKGEGPLTGRGMGFCVTRISDGPDEPVSANEAVSPPDRKEVKAMPWGDGTGPTGLGPMTGRAAGFCAGYGVPGYANPVAGAWARGAYPAPAYGYAGVMRRPLPYAAYGPMWGRRFGRGFGWGFGRGRGFGRSFGRGRWR